jgi:hypothetical protein
MSIQWASTTEPIALRMRSDWRLRLVVLADFADVDRASSPAQLARHLVSLAAFVDEHHDLASNARPGAIYKREIRHDATSPTGPLLPTRTGDADNRWWLAVSHEPGSLRGPYVIDELVAGASTMTLGPSLRTLSTAGGHRSGHEEVVG